MKRIRILLLIVIVGMIWSCKDNPVEPDLGVPVIKFTPEVSEYKIKEGNSVTLSATVENAVNPVYMWLLDGKVLSTSLTFTFLGDNIGEFFINFRVEAENGHDEKQIKVSVLEMVSTVINNPSEMIVYIGENIEITADALYAENAEYVWLLNETIVSEEQKYTYNGSVVGSEALTLKITTEDGSTSKVITITTLPIPNPEMFFDNGQYRTVTNAEDPVRMSVSLGKSIVMAPAICNIKDTVSFVWTVNGATQSSSTEYFTFTPTAKGEYTITVTESGSSVKAEVTVTCTDPEGTFFRPVTAQSKATAAAAFDYIPAPGQFINYQTGSVKTGALQDLQSTLNSASSSHIGAYGGYMIVGFDHSVENIDGKSDLRITGNTFAEWGEPGIVWVMQDENGNGLPDDTWYELKGSEADNKETIKRYAITYYKPSTGGSSVLWSDNIGRTGSIDRHSLHPQAYYFPMFITEDSYTLTGTLLPPTFYIEDGLEKNKEFAWGYVDNLSSNPTRPYNEFWIEDAIQVDGSPVNLQYIDFVKVHTAVIGKGNAVGELSTEPGCPTDINFQN